MRKSLLLPLTFCLVFCVADASDKQTYLEPSAREILKENPIQMTTEEICLLATVQHEASNQSVKGQLAVLGVVFNRMKKHNKSACKVVMQKGQFSWVNGRYSLKPTKESVKLLPLVRQAILDRKNGTFVDYTHGATHFHTVKTKPYWSSPKHTVKLAVHGSHIFYKIKES